MTLQTNGTISLENIGVECKDTSPYLLSNYSPQVLKKSGDSLSISEFYGHSVKEITLLEQTFDVYTGREIIVPITNLLSGSVDGFSNGQETIRLISVLNPIAGTVVIDGINVLFTSTAPPEDSAGFDMIVENSIGIQKTHHVTMNVIAIPPVICNPDTYSLQQGEVLLLEAAQLLANDEDTTNTGLTFVSVSNPIGGSVSYDGSSISYTSTGLSGEPAQFDYQVKNGDGDEQTGTVYVSVTPLPELEAFVYQTETETLAAVDSYTPPTMEDVFNNWGRFNGNEFYANRQEAIDQGSTNASAWTFDETLNSVVMPLNVAPANGFVSEETVDNYVFEATLTSDNGDNDTIGLVAAFVREDTTNYILTIVLNTGGMNPSTTGCGVYFGYYGVGTGDKQLGEFDIGVGNGWSGRTVRVKVQRQGDIFSFYVTNWDQTGSYLAQSEIVIDLNSDTDLERFKGKQSYGYLTYSQPNSTYLDISFKGGLDTSKLYDAQNNTVWEYTDDSWSMASGTLQSYLSYIRKVYNRQTEERFLIYANSILWLGRLVDSSTWSNDKLINQEQYVLQEEDLAQGGAISNVQLLALYAPDKEEKNYLKDLPVVYSTSAHVYNSDTNSQTTGYNNIGAINWFAEQNIDLVSTDFIGGTVVFAGGIVGRITAIGNDNGNSAYVYYQVVNYRLFDLTV